jgi:hypothetical protein
LRVPIKVFSHLKHPQVRFEKSAISTRPGYFARISNMCVPCITRVLEPD